MLTISPCLWLDRVWFFQPDRAVPRRHQTPLICSQTGLDCCDLPRSENGNSNSPRNKFSFIDRHSWVQCVRQLIILGILNISVETISGLCSITWHRRYIRGFETIWNYLVKQLICQLILISKHRHLKLVTVLVFQYFPKWYNELNSNCSCRWLLF